MSKPLTPLGLTVLRMLCDQPMHPYEMQQRIRDHRYDLAVKITHGSLYHSVERLAGGGLIEPLETSREGRRPERTVYAVTSAGRDAAHLRMAELLAEPAAEFPLLGTALAFIALLPEADVARRLHARAVSLEARLAANRTAYDALLKSGLRRYMLLDQEWTMARLRDELDFVRHLAADLDAGRLTWSDDAGGAAGRDPRARNQDAGDGRTTEENTDA